MFLNKNVGIFAQLPLLYFQKVTVIPTIIYDIYNYFSLNINGDSLLYKSSGDNNTFIDNSYSYITNAGTNQPTQGTFTPLSPANWSGYFDGSSYLIIPNNSVLQFGSSEFTIEFWWNPARTNSNYDIMGKWGSEWIFQYRNDIAGGNGFRFEYNTSVVRDFSYTTLLANVWTHVALSKDSSGNYRLFINGTQVGTTQTDTTSINGTSTNLQIGNITIPYTGYISNLRIIKGTALYTSNFTPNSAEPLKLLPNTSLLTLQNNIFIDNSRNKHTITTQGSPQNRPFSPIIPSSDYDLLLHGGSLYLDGTNYLNVSSNPLLSFPNGTDFTIECWVNLLSLANNRLLAVSTDGFLLYLADGTVTFGVYGGTTSLTSPANILKINQWYHIAVTRSGTVARLFINGVQVSINNNDTLNYAQNAFRIGADFSTTPATTTGYISNLRIVKGQAVYTSNFTLPNKLVDETSNGGATLIESGTSVPNLSVAPSLLLNFNNGGIIDQSCKNNILVFGDTKTQTVSSKFGNGSLIFDGTGDYLSIPNNPDLVLGTGDFTIEFWVTRSGNNIAQQLIDYRTSGTSEVRPTIYITATNQISYLVSSADRITAAIPLNTWTHVAVVKNSSKTLMFVNGVSALTAYTDTNDYLSPTNGVRIGISSTSSSAFSGYLEDIRITKGVARYTTNNFTPPAKLQANISDPYYNNVALLLNGNNIGSPVNNVFRGTYGDAVSLPVTRVNLVTQGSFSPFSPNGWSGYFNGSSMLTAPYSNNNFSFPTTTAFTIECWFNITGNAPLNSSARHATLISTDSGGFNGYTLYIQGNSTTTGTGIRLQYYGTSVGNTILATINISKNKWYHFALTRDSSNEYSMYLNGIKLTTSNSTLPNYAGIGGTNFGIGRNYEQSGYIYWFLGYISNLRIIKGRDIYKSNFTPPTGPLPALSGSGYSTSLLTLQNNRFIDNSPNNLAISVGGGTPATKVYNPFKQITEYSPILHGGSGYFDGDTYLRISNTGKLFYVATSNFTIECFVYISASSTSSKGIMAQENSTSGWTFRINANNTIAFFYAGVTTANISSSTSIIINQWNHIAATKSGNTVRLFINGIQRGSLNFTGHANADAGTNVIIGNERDASTATNRINGYISNLRFVKGKALYLTDFTPPTSPVTAVNGTVLLLNFNNGCVIDSTGNNIITTFGNSKTDVLNTAPLSSSTGSLYFDGTGDYMTVPFNDSINNFGLNDFTIETWLNIAVENVNYGIICCLNSWSSTANTVAYVIRLLSNKIVFYANNSISLFTSTTTISANRWYHVAVSRESNVFRLYVDGVLEGTVTSSLNMNATNRLHIGRFPDGSEQFNGYIDDLRIINGVARYTQSYFTLPTYRNETYNILTYPNDPFRSYVVLDLNGDTVNNERNNTFTDKSGNNLTITRGGNATQGSFSPFSPAGWSGLFNGSSLSLSNNNAFAFGAGDFTVEFWINPSISSQSNFTKYFCTGVSQGNFIIDQQTTTNQITVNDGLTVFLTSDIYGIIPFSWNHIAVTRSAGTLRIFINGIVTNSVNNTTTFTQAGAYIGGSPTNTQNFNGYISNLRVVKGQALYTNAFTPLTAALTTTSTVSDVTLSAENVSLLTLQDNRFKDNSNNNFTITPTGTPSVRPFSPFQPTSTYLPTVHGGSGYFNSTTDVLSIATNTAFAIGTDKFTLQFWINFTSWASTGGVQRFFIIGANGTDGLVIAQSNNNIIVNITNTTKITYAFTPTLNIWYHFSLIRRGTGTNELCFYINGKNVANATSTENIAQNAVNIGGLTWAGGYQTLGYISNLRLIKGNAITPPVGGPTALVQAVSGTSLLLNFDNAGVVDSTSKNNVITYNTAKIDYSNEVYGSGALSFNGTNDYMQVGRASDWTFLHAPNAKWTIEFWIYNNSSTSAFLLDTANNGIANIGVGIQKMSATNYIRFYIAKGSTGFVIDATSTTSIPLTTWTHIAITYDDLLTTDNMVMYFNGVNVNTFTKTANSPTTSNPTYTLTIGCAAGQSNFLNGSIDELRITNAVRYTSNFSISSYTQPLSS